MDITDYILQHTNKIVSQPEYVNVPPGFQMFNTGGVEVEVAEFLYSFARMTKPGMILETGTHLGISSLYIALALQKNQKGSLWTFEVIPELQLQAKSLWSDLGVSSFIGSHLLSSLNAQIPDSMAFDLLFLDSEPQFRFDEFLKFWPKLNPGGFIIIHDLHPSLGHHGETHHGVYDWPYGDFREKIGSLIKNHEIQTISFPTPRGLTIFQKEAPGYEAITYLRSEEI